MTTWDPIWKNDSYSETSLRRIKASVKADSFAFFLNLKTEDVCLDIGCGGGYVSKELSDRFKCKIIGCDTSIEAISFANENNKMKNSNFIVASATKLPFESDSVDAVVCVGVLEHILDVEIALSEIRRVLKPHGKLVVITSNYYSVMYIDRIIKQILGVWKYGYQKNWSPKKFSELLLNKGFKISNFKILQGIGDFNNKTLLDKIINKVFANWGRYIIFMGEK